MKGEKTIKMHVRGLIEKGGSELVATVYEPGSWEAFG